MNLYFFDICHSDFQTSRQKLGKILESKVLQKIELLKTRINESCSTNQILLGENHFQKDSADF